MIRILLVAMFIIYSSIGIIKSIQLVSFAWKTGSNSLNKSIRLRNSMHLILLIVFVVMILLFTIDYFGGKL
ncbi:hypothetical protein D3C73_687900 [compost metagenome]